MVIVRTFGDAIVSQDLNREAWKKLSAEFKWTEELLTKYEEKVDWEMLSINTAMLWTVSMLEKFEGNIAWSSLSYWASESLLTIDIINRFANNWDWHELSKNQNLKLSFALLDNFADKWDWGCIINRWTCTDSIFTPEFFERYKDFIPADAFMTSYLRGRLIELRMSELEQLIVK